MKNRKIIIAMSGGVDSSTTAALLKRAGFSVKGVFMRLVDSPSFKGSEKRAKKVAKALGIPLLVVDLRKEFKKRIIDSWLADYKRGLTPNPCVHCNNLIKFDLLLKKARASDKDFFATGHYVSLKEKAGKVSLVKGKDKDKEQSYFLWQLSQKQLKQALFPVGHYTKKEVRALAKELKLPAAGTSESQEICFVPGEVNDFLKKHLKVNPGKIVDSSGKVLGKHQGLHFHTIGQRRGIGLAAGPYYVLGKDLKKNILIVTKKEKDLLQKELVVKDVNWISGKASKLPLSAAVKIRYRHKGGKAQVKRNNSKTLKVVFDKPQRAITSGQSAVFYVGQGVVGGGIIC